MFKLGDTKSDAKLAEELRSVLKKTDKICAKLLDRGYNVNYHMEWNTSKLTVKVEKTYIESI